jgi:hypothetical protein
MKKLIPITTILITALYGCNQESNTKRNQTNELRISMSYPSDHIPEMSVCAKSISNNKETCIHINETETNFDIIMYLEPDKYTVYSKNIKPIPYISKQKSIPIEFFYYTTTHNFDHTLNLGKTEIAVADLTKKFDKTISIDYWRTIGEVISKCPETWKKKGNTCYYEYK